MAGEATYADALAFGKITAHIGTDATPPVYTGLIGIQQLEWSQDNTVKEVTIPNATNPDAPAKTIYFPEASKDQATLSGTIDLTTRKLLQAANDKVRDSGAATNFKILVDEPLAKGGGNWAGLAYITGLKMTGQERDVWKFSCTLNFVGRATWTDAAA